MTTVELTIPQMGEGLEQVLITQLFKKEGQSVLKDETLYEMETDKATLSIESAYEGVVKEWLGKKGDVMDVGAPIVRLEVKETAGKADSPVEGRPDAFQKSVTAKKGFRIPPAIRSHCLKLGITEDEMLEIPAPNGKLTTDDVDTYLKEKESSLNN